MVVGRLGRRWNGALAAALTLGLVPLAEAAVADTVASPGTPGAPPSPAAVVAPTGPAAHANLPANWPSLEQRCVKCHNSEDWAGGIAFDTLSPHDIGPDADTWEKVVRKLRGRLMPPPGQPQPDQHSIDDFVGSLEGTLDAVAAAHPDPGSIGLHRLNRTEYANEIRDILGLSVDVKTLLPKDVSSDGFDDIAATLRVSPAFLDQYIAAARAISRQAVGSVTGKPESRDYRESVDIDQSGHIDGLPLGTRGGMVITHYFPVDGEYEFNIGDFYFAGSGYVTKIDAPHRVILTIDGDRVFTAVAGGAEDLKSVDLHYAVAADEIQARFNHIRVRISAGSHRVGVAFVERSLAQSDSPLQPIAELPEMERSPAIPGLQISGPFNATGTGDTESRRQIFICRPANAAGELPCARRIFLNLAARSFRRPATEADLTAPLAFYREGREQGDFEAGIEAGLTAILSSTKFLFRVEPPPAGAAPGTTFPIRGTALASRLSFFLWSSGPDAQLLQAATAGELDTPSGLAAQVHRMLADPRAHSLVDNFAFQWLEIAKIDGVEPTPTLYPDFDRDLRDGLREEIREFLASILLGDHNVLELLDSDRTFLNERLGRLYGVPGIQGAQFRPVRLTDPNRFGLLGKGAVLMATSYGNRTAPVLRGAWILDNLTGTPPNSPPPGITPLAETEPGKQAATVRERLERHRANPSCNACHGVLDPLGFALENFDVVGAWRDHDLDAGTSIDARGQLADGTLVASPAQLRAVLMKRPDQFVQTLTEKLMTFALGRALTYHDLPTVRAIVRAADRRRDSLESIIQGIVAAPAFQMQEIPAPAPQTHQALVPARTSVTGG